MTDSKGLLQTVKRVGRHTGKRERCRWSLKDRDRERVCPEARHKKNTDLLKRKIASFRSGGKTEDREQESMGK